MMQVGHDGGDGASAAGLSSNDPDDDVIGEDALPAQLRECVPGNELHLDVDGRDRLVRLGLQVAECGRR